MTIEDLFVCLGVLWSMDVILNVIMFCVLCDNIKELIKELKK